MPAPSPGPRFETTADLGARFELTADEPGDKRKSTMAREVREGLLGTPRSLPPKYFYDDVGSRLFDAICELPEYYVTRAERALLARHARAIVDRSSAQTLVEIGSGMARKTAPLLEALCARSRSPLYVPFDIAPEPIRESAASLLASFPTLRVRGVVGDFAHDCARIALGAPALHGPRLFAFLGSTIGNLDEREAPAFLSTFAGLMGERDRFLLGIDLVKSERVLHAAYNDAGGLTAAFNKNVLRVLARELDGIVDESAFFHRAHYDASRSRIEMHLVAERKTTLTLRRADLDVAFAREEGVRTEISRKFTRETTEHMLARGGLQLVDWVADPDAGDESFALATAKRAS